MNEFLLVGTALGALFGCLHGLLIWRRQAACGASLKGGYHAAWTVGLWTLLGSYVLAFWLLGAVLMAASRALGVRGAA